MPPKSNFSDRDIKEMKRLRFQEHLTLDEIGRRQDPPISREYVRQLIGNTGQVARVFRRSEKVLQEIGDSQ